MMFGLGLPTEVEGTVDVAIIGGGPAGLTAAVYLARKKRLVAIITKELGGQVAWTLGIENYMGYQYITGKELTDKFVEQVRQFPIPVVTDEVTELRVSKDGFTVQTAGGRSINARAVIVASGKRPRELGIPDEKKFVGKGLSYCATCDGPLFVGKDVAICGGGNSAVQAAIDMAQISSKVYIVSRNPWRAEAVVADRANALRNLEKRTGYIVVGVVGEKSVEGLRVKENTTGMEEVIPVKGVFVEVGLDPNTGFLKGIVDLNEYGEVVVDCMCKTKVPGLFAAGDVTLVPEKQIVVAAGEGAKAALSAHEYLTRQ
jgi:alkyl hydroperoxide reductase subunit F